MIARLTNNNQVGIVMAIGSDGKTVEYYIALNQIETPAFYDDVVVEILDNEIPKEWESQITNGYKETSYPSWVNTFGYYSLLDEHSPEREDFKNKFSEYTVLFAIKSFDTLEQARQIIADYRHSNAEEQYKLRGYEKPDKDDYLMKPDEEFQIEELWNAHVWYEKLKQDQAD